MSYLLKDLVLDRVDLVDEGANSEASIELYKRKEYTMKFEEILSKMKPEHAAVIQAEIAKSTGEQVDATQIDTLTAELTKAKEDLANAEEALAKATEEKLAYEEDCKKRGGFDEEETLKSMPTEIREYVTKMRLQKETAEAELIKAREAEKNSEAIAKAAELKSLPIESGKLVDVLKRCDSEMVDVLTAINAAIDSTVLKEVGGTSINKSTDAWAKIEKKAQEIAERDSVTVAKATSAVIRENPALYKEYLEGGAN